MFSSSLKNAFIGAQNVSTEECGAFTGELSASMLKSANVSYCIVGHSERRTKLHETDEDINKKVQLLLEQNITPIICIGEKLEEISKKKSVLSKQLTGALKNVDKDFIVAYEPVWAIGTGKSCGEKDIEETHKYIKEKIKKLTGKDIMVLYGGSVKSSNAESILNTKYVDGVLVGGACLKTDEFYKIIQS